MGTVMTHVPQGKSPLRLSPAPQDKDKDKAKENVDQNIKTSDPDRDRQREQQRKERAQMLPDDKQSHVPSEDLFSVPVRVAPSINDKTSLQIRNSLGSFDQVRSLMENPGLGYHPITPSSNQHRNPYGVDPQLPPPPPPAYRPVIPPPVHNSGYSSVEAPSANAKGFHRNNPYQGNHHPSISATVSNNTHPTHNIGGSGLYSSSTSHPVIANTSSSSSFRVPSTNQIPPVSKLPHNQPQLSQSTPIFNTHTTVLPTTSLPINHLTSSGPILNHTPSLNSNTNTSSSSQGKHKPYTTSHGHNFISDTFVGSADVKLEGASGSFNETSSSVFNNDPFLNSSNANVRDAKCYKNSVPITASRRPVLARVDSQLEVESILKEMTDVVPPLSAIQTPVKEISKKLPPRRSSKSEEKIVQSIIDSGMARVPSPIAKMDSSSSSSSSDSDSDSDDSGSSGSQSEDEKDKVDNSSHLATVTSGSPNQKWNLSSFLNKPPAIVVNNSDNSIFSKPVNRSPKDMKFGLDSDPMNTFGGSGSTDRLLDSVTSSKSTPPFSLLENASTPDPPETRAMAAARTTRGSSSSRQDTPKVVSPVVPLPSKTLPQPPGINAKVTSLSATSSEDEDANAKPPPKVKRKSASRTPDDKKTSTSGATAAKRPRPSASAGSSSSSSKQKTNKTATESSPEKSSPEGKTTGKGAKNNTQDKNKTDTIRKLFRWGNKSGSKESPTLVSEPAVAKSTSSSRSSSATSPGKQSSSNRVSGKGKSSTSSSSTSTHNGDVKKPGNVRHPSSIDKKKETSKDSKTKTKSKTSSQTSQSQSKKSKSKAPSTHKNPKTAAETVNTSSFPPLLSKVKEEKQNNASSSPSSLIVKIPLDKLLRPPSSEPEAPSAPPTTTPVTPAAHTFLIPGAPPSSFRVPSPVKREKDYDRVFIKGGKPSSGSSGSSMTESSSSSSRSSGSKGSHNSSRKTGSSHEHPVIKSTPPTTKPKPREHSLSSKSDRKSQEKNKTTNDKNSTNKKRPKVKKSSKSSSSSSSPKKAKIKQERPDSYTKHDDLTDKVVSSLRYGVCDSVTRTPPDHDVVQAPDSSLNPSHLHSYVQPQLQYFSFYERPEIKDDLLSRDQDAYLEEAKKLKHLADNERTPATQSSMYLEAGLYFILTGIIMERDSTGNNNASYTMYRDTLTLIQYISQRWRNARLTGTSPETMHEAKIITLSMRCQALLFCKLFRMRMKETREMVVKMHDFFTSAVSRDPLPIPSSPQLSMSTPSPHSPSSSPARSTGGGSSRGDTPGGGSARGDSQHTPSPSQLPHPLLPSSQLMSIPKPLYNHIQKQSGNIYNCIMAHDTWDQADSYVARFRLEDFFVSIDRHLGPLTLHSTPVDLVRYVRHGLRSLGLLSSS